MGLGAILYVYKGDLDLPTIDFECLRSMCLVKFTRYPIKIDLKGNPFRSGDGKLPYLQIADKKFVGYQQIKALLDKGQYAIDSKLNEMEQHLSAALTQWVFTNLHAYYFYFMFGEPNNFQVTRELYARRLWFPFNCYYPSKYQKEAEEVVQVLAGFDINDKLITHQSDYLIINAKKCVNLLSQRLGRKVWFFGDYFSEFDATVYSYLVILYKVQLKTNPLQNHIKSCKNLVDFIKRITRDIFPTESLDILNSMKKVAGSTTTNPFDKRSRIMMEKRKEKDMATLSKILASLAAVFLMTLFAIRNGVFQKLNSLPNFDSFPGDDEDGEVD